MGSLPGASLLPSNTETAGAGFDTSPLGNEGCGLSPETRRLCRRMLSIFPGRELQPGIESLNVSVAAGILLHSICSQKMKAT
ncbi:UNVERIFIED_CONTAM: Ribose methyltransferase [Gekko kuhli]